MDVLVGVLIGSTALTTGLSNEKMPERVPTVAETVITTVVRFVASCTVGLISPLMTHNTEEALLHDDVVHCSPPSMPLTPAVAVRSDDAKFRPSSVVVPP